MRCVDKGFENTHTQNDNNLFSLERPNGSAWMPPLSAEAYLYCLGKTFSERWPLFFLERHLAKYYMEIKFWFLIFKCDNIQIAPY